MSPHAFHAAFVSLMDKKNRHRILCCRFHHSLPDSRGDHVGISVHRVNIRRAFVVPPWHFSRRTNGNAVGVTAGDLLCQLEQGAYRRRAELVLSRGDLRHLWLSSYGADYGSG